MIEIMRVGKIHPVAKVNLIFFHGISGNFTDTWRSEKSTQKQPWPEWLTNDCKLDSANVWLLEYPSELINFNLNDELGRDKLSELLIDHLEKQNDLKIGKIVFVGHSNGGNIIKQIFKTTIENPKFPGFSSNFLPRVRGVVFYDTPHNGIFWNIITEILVNEINFRTKLRPSLPIKFIATALNPVIKKHSNKFQFLTIPKSVQEIFTLILKDKDSHWPISKALSELGPYDPTLIILRDWYESYCKENGIFNLIFTVKGGLITLFTNFDKISGKIVSVKKGHKSICKPTTKNCKTYKELVKFVQKCVKK